MRRRFSEAKNSATDIGESLYDAASAGRLAVVRQLLSQRISPEATNDDETPLYVACANGHLEVATCLLDAKANVNRTTRTNATPLYVATQFTHVHVATLLLKRRADPNLGMYGEITPLMLAARTGVFEMVHLLLTHGANTSLKSEGKTAVEWAAHEQHDDIVTLFRKGVDSSESQARIKAKKMTQTKNKDEPSSIWDSPKLTSRNVIVVEDDTEEGFDTVEVIDDDDDYRGVGVFAVMSPVRSPSRSRSPSPPLCRSTSSRSTSPQRCSPLRSRSPITHSRSPRVSRSPPRSPRSLPPSSERGFKKSLINYIPAAQYRAFAAAANGQDETDKLTHTNVGHRMLQKMGWQEGMGLGRQEDGMLAPVAATSKALSKGGVGLHTSTVRAEDDNFTKYKKMMMLAYKHRQARGPG